MTTRQRRVCEQLRRAAADAHRVADAEDAKARLRAEFPDWSIIVSSKGRWWATCGPKSGDLVNHGPSVFEADSSEELRALLRGAPS